MISLLSIIVILFVIYIATDRDTHKSTILTRTQNQSFRCILALLIVLSHVSQSYTFPLHSQGMVYGMTVVGIFFFFSGYGLMTQYLSKGEKYLHNFLYKRSKKLLPSFLVILFLITFVSKVTDIQLLEMRGSRIGCILIPNSWFVYVLFYYYIAFVFSAKLFKKPKNVILSLVVSTILLIGFVSLVGLGDWWWKSCFAFNIGTALPLLENLYSDDKYRSKERNLVLMSFCIMLLCALPIVLGVKFYIIRKFLMIILTTILPIYLYLIFRKLEFPTTKTMNFIGSMSYEIYLIHGAVILLLMELLLEKSTFISVVIVYVLSIILSWPISRLSRMIK